jgi:hypothetical protein
MTQRRWLGKEALVVVPGNARGGDATGVGAPRTQQKHTPTTTAQTLNYTQIFTNTKTPYLNWLHQREHRERGDTSNNYLRLSPIFVSYVNTQLLSTRQHAARDSKLLIMSSVSIIKITHPPAILAACAHSKAFSYHTIPHHILCRKMMQRRWLGKAALVAAEMMQRSWVGKAALVAAGMLLL